MDDRSEAIVKAMYEKFNENLIGNCVPFWHELPVYGQYNGFKERLFESFKAGLKVYTEQNNG